jgi:drug/metabolite transporter (DMT)-like permease
MLKKGHGALRASRIEVKCASMSWQKQPIVAGASAAILAALSFGVTAPLVTRAGSGIGPLTTATLLYAGAAASSLIPFGGTTAGGAPLERKHAWRLLAMALVGGGLAPTLLAWGLQRTGGTAGSLLLNLEAVFTVLLAWLVYREPIGRRVGAALAFMTLGGALLALDVSGGGASGSTLYGVLALAGATLAWACDNTLSRALAQQDPVRVVAIKGLLGALTTATLARAFGEALPSWGAALALFACGASGYGLSLRLYLIAQRRMGAARTGSIFAIAPFVGAALGLLLGDHAHGLGAAMSALFFALGLWLHLTERHRHAHVHQAVDHDHPHRHDDGHHDHVHDPPVSGEHSHHHDTLEHTHEHAPDLHHDHSH